MATEIIPKLGHGKNLKNVDQNIIVSDKSN